MRFVLGFVIAATLCGDAAVAQRASGGTMPPETGTRLGTSQRNPGAEYGIRFARCLAGWKPREAAAFVASAPGTAESDLAYRALVPFRDNRCVSIGSVTIGGASLEMPMRLLRGYVAQALYLARHDDGPPSFAGTAEDIPVEVYNARVTSSPDQPSEIIRIFGECMARRHPAEVDRLLRTDVESSEEGTAINALAPDMGACLWNGQSIEFNRESLRAALADGLYRMTIAAPARVAG